MTPAEIASLRKALGLTAKVFAGKLGFMGQGAAVTVYRWERGERTPSPQTVMLMRMMGGKVRQSQGRSARRNQS